MPYSATGEVEVCGINYYSGYTPTPTRGAELHLMPNPMNLNEYDEKIGEDVFSISITPPSHDVLKFHKAASLHNLSLHAQNPNVFLTKLFLISGQVFPKRARMMLAR